MKRRKRVLLAMDYYDYRVHRGVARVARQKGWSLLCQQSTVGVPLVPDGWSGEGVVALISSEKTKAALMRLSCPMVDLGLWDHGIPLHRVVTDNEEISRLAAQHFLERGFSTYIYHREHLGSMFEERRDSFRQEIDRQLPNAKWIPIDGLNLSEIRERAKQYPFPWAYWGYVDSLALQLMDIAIHLGHSVPDDIAILGTDNNDLICESFDVGLSSIDSDQEGLGARCAQVLDRLMQGEGECPTIQRHAPKGVVVRASSDMYTSDNPDVQRALATIDHHLGDGITANELADKMGCAPQTLQRWFKDHYHFTPAETIRNARMQLAKMTLTQTQWPLEKVAQMCGYGSLDSMCRCFRRDDQSSPGRYRKGGH